MTLTTSSLTSFGLHLSNMTCWIVTLINGITLCSMLLWSLHLYIHLLRITINLILCPLGTLYQVFNPITYSPCLYQVTREHRHYHLYQVLRIFLLLSRYPAALLLLNSFGYNESTITAYLALDNKNDTLTQSQMLKTSDAKDFIANQVLVIHRLSKMG
jgi:hypothetical protein